MAEYLSPGVYVEEFESGGKPMEGVGTSTAGFVGLAKRGPVEGLPQLVTSFADFKRTYGDYLAENEFGDYRYLAYAVESFFVNGGTRAFIMRVAPQSAKAATGFAPSKDAAALTFTAKNPGSWGNDLKVNVSKASKAKTQVLSIDASTGNKKYIVKNAAGFMAGDTVVFEDKTAVYNKIVSVQDNVITFEKDFPDSVVDTKLLPDKVITTCEFNVDVKYNDIVESYANCSFNVNSPNFVVNKMAKSDLVSVMYNDSVAPKADAKADAKDAKGKDAKADTKTDAKAADILSPMDIIGVESVEFSGGANGSASDITAADFMGVDNGAGKRTGIQAFIDNDVVSIMAVPGITDPNVQLTLVAHCENLASRFAVLDVPKDAKKVQDITNHRNIFDSNYAALYHPWLTVFDPLSKKNISIPPSGAVIGIYARTDNERGVFKAPANEVVKACVGLDVQFNKGEQDILNPKGVNLIRSFPGQGIRVWGARTATSDPSWKYVNVRRLFIFLEETIKANTNWAVFEPNDEALWVRVQRTISVFLTNQWRTGALAGSSPDQAFYVNVGPETMSQDDIDNGRLIVEIGVAPVKPAEFVIFRITQKTSEAAAAAE